MHKPCHRFGLVLAFCLAASPWCRGQDWTYTRDEESGDTIATMRLKLYPQPASQPALKYELIPDPFDRLDGNAALYYLKAMGFFEQTSARQAIDDYWRRARERSQQEGKEIAAYPPSSWLEMPIQELPVEQLKEYLHLSSFQPPLLAEAARQKHFSLDRHIRQVDNPVGYLLPEIQTIRELARKQSLRCRLAIAEGRAEDAVAILGQQYAMANHLGQDEFLVSALVGASVSGIASTDALLLVQLQITPNLYWSIAALPDPLVDMQDAYAFERQFLFEQLKILREVDETPRTAGYWQDFIDRLAPQLLALDEGILPDFPRGNGLDAGSLDRTSMTAFIAASYPAARRYLIEKIGMEPEKVDAYPTAQVVLLAAVKFHWIATDEFYKWNHVAPWQAAKQEAYRQLDDWLGEQLQELGWASAPVSMFMTAFKAARTAQYRVQQSLAMLQTVEAIRMYAAENDGKLPVSLEDLPVPAPLDPFSGEPIAYEYNRWNAVLSGSRAMPGYRQRLVLEMVQD